MKKAFTLIEMLIAIILLSLLIGLSIFSLRLQFMTIKKIQLNNMSKIIKFNQLKTTIESMKYYAVQEFDILNRPIKYKWYFFFQGDEEKMIFVTQNPIFIEEDALVKLECLENKLIYTEEALYGKIDFLKPSFLKNSRKYILYDNLKTCNINYFNTKGDIKKKLFNEIPLIVHINLNQDDFFIRIRNDYNLTIKKIFNRIYR